MRYIICERPPIVDVRLRPHLPPLLCLTRVHIPNGIWIGSAVFVKRLVTSNGQTDHGKDCSKRPPSALRAHDAA